MKKIMLLLLCLLLTGCSNQNTIDIQSAFDEAINSAIALPSGIADNNKNYYAYYLEPEIGRIYSDETSSIFKYHDTKFIMNLNISKIVNAMNYGDIIPKTIKLDDNYLVAYNTGTYYDYDNSVYDYEAMIYQLNNDTYYVCLDTKYVTLAAKGSILQMLEVIKPMLKIAKTIRIDKENIMVAYSAKERISFESEELKLFDEVIPSDGKVQEMVDMVEKPQDTNAPVYDPDEFYQSDDLN